MKLATRHDGTLDGELCVVSTDLSRAVSAAHVARTLQLALEDWSTAELRLGELSAALNDGLADGAFDFVATEFLAPLPRAYQFIDAGGYMSHMKRMRAARGASMPERWDVEPAMYQGLSDDNLPGHADLVGDPEWGLDFETEIAVIVDNVSIRADQAVAASAIRLLVLLNDVSLRKLIPTELGKGFGFLQSKPACHYAPVAITPDELGDAWSETKAVCRVRNEVNGEVIGEPWSGVDQQFSFAQIIEYATRTRSLTAGTIVGAGTISNYDDAAGVSCLVEKYVPRGLDPIFFQPRDRLRIEAFDPQGRSLFGAIDQAVRLAPWLIVDEEAA